MSVNHPSNSSSRTDQSFGGASGTASRSSYSQSGLPGPSSPPFHVPSHQQQPLSAPYRQQHQQNVLTYPSGQYMHGYSPSPSSYSGQGYAGVTSLTPSHDSYQPQTSPEEAMGFRSMSGETEYSQPSSKSSMNPAHVQGQHAVIGSGGYYQPYVSQPHTYGQNFFPTSTPHSTQSFQPVSGYGQQTPYPSGYGVTQPSYAYNPYAPPSSAQVAPSQAYGAGPGWHLQHQQQHPPWLPPNVNAMPPTAYGRSAAISSAQSNYSRPRPDAAGARNRSIAHNNSSPSSSQEQQSRKSTGSPFAAPDRNASPLEDSTVLRDSADNETEGKLPGKVTRSHYHPQQGPRSNFVLWCGNVPADSTVEELWSFFSQLPPEEKQSGEHVASEAEITEEREPGPVERSADERCEESGEDSVMAAGGHGVMSVFIISRSNCAFINYVTQRHLHRAVKYFHGLQLRSQDPRCPKLVCRVRKKDDEAQAGVAGQRGRGMHVAYVKEQKRKIKEEGSSCGQREQSTSRSASCDAPLAAPQPLRGDTSSRSISQSSDLPSIDPPNDISTPKPIPSVTVPNGLPNNTLEERKGNQPTDSTISLDSSSGSVSFTSTNSLLFRHPAFRERFFILKSLRAEDLQKSIDTGLWATQPHNEPVLDQAYRNSEAVFLIFSANQSGGFNGYARMAGPIYASNSEQEAAGHQVRKSISSPPSHRNATALPTSIVEGDEEQEAGQSIASDALPMCRSPPARQMLSSSGPSDVNPTMTSPQQLTPSTEEAPSVVVGGTAEQELSEGPRTWPVSTAAERAEDEARLRRGATLSPNHLLSKPVVASPVTSTSDVPALTSTASGRSFEQPLDRCSTPKIMLQQDTTQRRTLADLAAPTLVEKDEFGVRRKDMVGDIASLNINNEQISKPSVSPGVMSEGSSLAPSDSISLQPSDSKAQNQIAMRALIHNLRLEERESVKKAEQLEAEMSLAAEKDGNKGASPGEECSTSTAPQAGSSDSWGKPFKVEWIKTTPLAFTFVRKLRNPWRDNRQVKVSRDGTELEPNVGRQLLMEWEKPENDARSKARLSKGGGVEEDEDEW